MSLALSSPFVQLENLYDILTKKQLIDFIKNNFHEKKDMEKVIVAYDKIKNSSCTAQSFENTGNQRDLFEAVRDVI